LIQPELFNAQIIAPSHESKSCYTCAMFPILQTQTPPGVIDLGLGDPPLRLLPLDLIRASAQRQLTQSENSFLQYGAEQGDGRFLLALTNFLTHGYGFDVQPESLLVTNGVSKALDLICTLFTQSGDTIFVEEPSYFLALKIFADHHLNVIPIDTDKTGLIPASLEEKLAGSRPRFLYLIPSFHNPTGHTLSQERRERLVQLAKEHDLLIVADEVYHFLNYGSQTFKPFAFYTEADAENIISLGSFSKILAPGLRLGWVQAHPKIIKRFIVCGLLDSGGGMNPFTSAMIRDVIESGGLEKHIGRLRHIYQDQASAMAEALRLHLPEAVYNIPQGGYFFWLRLPNQINTRELRKQASVFKVDFRPGALFSSRNGLENYMRLCFVHYEKDEIKEGVWRLKQSLAKVP
jgi:DNA-binding transcriptional MocR family regulator